MSAASRCPELDELFDAVIAGEGPALEHALDCAACSAVLEEHRQLEKDLYRVVDPLPPPDLVRNVMARVEAAPAPARRELTTGLGILGGAVVLSGAALARDPEALANLGRSLAYFVLDAPEALPRFVSGLSVLWSAVGLTGMAACTSLLLVSLLGLKRLSGGPTASEA